MKELMDMLGRCGFRAGLPNPYAPGTTITAVRPHPTETAVLVETSGGKTYLVTPEGWPPPQHPCT